MTPATATAPVATTTQARRAFDLCVSKTRSNIEALADSPATWALAENGCYADWNEGFHEIGNWTTSFFTGMALLAWRDTGDAGFLRQIERLEPLYQAKVGEHAADTMHDLGIRAAGVLADRFIPEGNYIRAWGRMDDPDSEYAGLAIIDCMMNLPLLYWASDETGDPRYREIAIRHSDTTLSNFIREDDSVYHSYRFDALGNPAGGDNYCGRTIESHWARGTTWAIYGFALGYRHTRDGRYLDASLRLARRFISLLDDEGVPVWDFCLGTLEEPLRDSSAAAVAVCAFQELEALGVADESITGAARDLLERLCSGDYLDENPATQGILKFGEVGDGVGKAKSAYTSWGDYYFMEALARGMGTAETWW